MKIMKKYYVGIDLGGTNISVGVVDNEYNIISKSKAKTNCVGGAEVIAEDMAKVALDAISKANLTVDDIEWVGIGSPGTVNSDTGVIEYANNISFLNTPLAEMIKKTINKPIHVENDANAAAYGEFLAGGAKGVKDAVCITLGTGVGGGIIINGKIYSGFNCGGAEIGHSVVEADGPLCSCGRKGCFEVYSSATGLIRMTKEAMDNDKASKMWEISALENGEVTAKLAFDAMRAGDKSAKEVVDKYIKYLGLGLTNVINIFQPEILCIGGGVCNEGDTLLIPVKEYVAKAVYTKRSAKNTKIVIAKLGNDAGIIGAAFLGKQKV